MTQSHVGSAILRTVDDLRGPAGRLEALLNAGAPDAPYAALVCHPHPLGGGTMHNKVVYHAMKAFQSLGLPVLRFNFRGTELSEGEHDFGEGEQDDVRAALDWLQREFDLPILFAGFSFGSYVGLRACCGDPRVIGLVALGIPTHAEGRDYELRLPSRVPAAQAVRQRHARSVRPCGHSGSSRRTRARTEGAGVDFRSRSLFCE
jgi:alpha/beta superfamily hydrolase